MANFPIEIMVKLTYNIYGGDCMAEFCLDCWNKINGTNYSKSKFIMSKGLDFCEECEELKRIVIVERWSFYRYRLRYLTMPFLILKSKVLKNQNIK